MFFLKTRFYAHKKLKILIYFKLRYGGSAIQQWSYKLIHRIKNLFN